jgi:hypothetical protein
MKGAQMICTSCNSENDSMHKYCSKCGVLLGNVALGQPEISRPILKSKQVKYIAIGAGALLFVLLAAFISLPAEVRTYRAHGKYSLDEANCFVLGIGSGYCNVASHLISTKRNLLLYWEKLHILKADWVKVGSNENATIYVDMEHIHRTFRDDRWVSFPILVNYNKPNSFGSKSSTTQFIIDCGGDRVENWQRWGLDFDDIEDEPIKNYAEDMSGGSKTDDNSIQFQDAFDSSSAIAAWNAVCKQR